MQQNRDHTTACEENDLYATTLNSNDGDLRASVSPLITPVNPCSCLDVSFARLGAGRYAPLLHRACSLLHHHANLSVQGVQRRVVGEEGACSGAWDEGRSMSEAR